MMPENISTMKFGPRLVEFYNDKKYTDCTFLVEDQKFFAHKLILASHSTVFETMFNFNDNETHEIRDISAEHFKLGLDYIYTDSIVLESLETAWAMFYFANKYFIDSLKSLVLQYIFGNIGINNLVMCYEYSEMYGVTNLKTRCFCDMNNYLKAVFRNDYHMKPSTLRAILQENLFKMDRYELVMDILNWAANECDCRNIDVEARNVIDILDGENLTGLVVKLCTFRLCGDCGAEIAACQCCDKTLHESLLLILSLPRDSDEPPLDERKINLRPRVCKLRDVYKIAGRFDLWPFEPFVTTVSVSRDILVFGMLVNTLMIPNLKSIQNRYYYNGSITIKIVDSDTNLDIMKPTTVKDLMSYNEEYYVTFKDLAKLSKQVSYKILICYENHDCPPVSVSSIHSYYVQNLNNKDCKIVFQEINGSIITGVNYYPV